MASDASHMLEAALEQMDDIIAGSKAAVELTNCLCELGSPDSTGALQVLQLAEELRLALELHEDGDEGGEALRSQLPCSTAHVLLEWLERGTVNLQSPANNETYQERLRRLEGGKQSLALQVSVLTDQLEAQGEKIRDLEASLEDHHHKLLSTEEMLQQELLSHTSLESQKLDLMDEVSYLKLKLVNMEEEQVQANGNEQQHKAECVVNVISELQEQMRKFQQEISTRIQEQRAQEAQESRSEARNRSPDVGLGSSDAEDGGCRCGAAGDNALLQELHILKTKVDELESEKSQYERQLKATKVEISELQQQLASKDAEIKNLQNQLFCKGRLTSNGTERDLEMQRLKIGMENLLIANDEKERHIEELTAVLGQFHMNTTVFSQGCVDRLLGGSSEENLSTSLRTRPFPRKAHSDIVQSGLQVSTPHRPSHFYSPPGVLHKDLDSNCHSMQTFLEISVPCLDEPSFYNGKWSTQKLLSASLEELQSRSRQQYVLGQPVDPVLENRHILNSSKYRTLPGKLANPEQLPGDSEDGDVNLRKGGKGDGSTSSDFLRISPENKKNERGIRRLWGKIRRTQSGSFRAEGLPSRDFRRGGVRATAGPSLGHTGDDTRDMNTPFSKWSCDQVCVWLEDYGLGQYIPLARGWVSSGQTLLSASPHDFEKDLGMKHPLHRKKLQLGLQACDSGTTSAELDHIWVTRWLDDIGLPQYKDQFHEARVDGRVLQYLTVDDLLLLKVTSQLHHLSIKCAIQVLHGNKFNPNCLKRRPGEESQPSPSEVMQWSNHRVMEWLRAVDLAEYAPNLRGSGVHGGLIILDQSFNAECLAALLTIPPQKTLLRRHLATNFQALVGSQAHRDKLQFLESPGYTPLSTTAKVRPKKLGFSGFGHLRKKRPDDSTDYVCPPETLQTEVLLNGTQQPHPGLCSVQDEGPEGREQILAGKGTVMQIEALSEGMNHLTRLLDRDDLLEGKCHSQTAVV